MIASVRLFRLSPEPADDVVAAHRYCNDLAAMLNGDTALLEAISPHAVGRTISVEEFVRYTAEWCHAHRAESYAVVLGGAAIGLISFSHIDPVAAEARCGWWLTSRQWGQGHKAEAFAQLRALARARGIRRLGATFRRGTGPGSEELGLWQQVGATVSADGRFDVAWLPLD